MIGEIENRDSGFQGMPKKHLLPSSASLQSSYDVIVVGAGSGGIAAAVQAARTGAATLLIEPSAHIGGQLLAVPTMDEGHVKGEGYPIRQAGIYAEFIQRIREKYKTQGKSVGTCYWRGDSIAFEPEVAENTATRLLEEQRGVTVLLKTKVVSVEVEGLQVTGVRTSSGKTFETTVLIDATECGDLLPLTPARYRVGKSTRERIDPRACIQDITYPVVVKKYPGGAPQELLMDTPPPGYETHLKQFSATINKQGHNWFKNNCGPTDDQPCWGKYPVDWTTHHAYRGLPDSSHPQNYSAGPQGAEKITKTLINWANDVPANASYLEDNTQREKDNARALEKTLSFVYYLQQQLGPEWALSEDETFSVPRKWASLPRRYREVVKHFPPHPYVRESRRIIPLRTLTGGDIKRQGSPPRAGTSFPHAVAVGYYPADLHGCSDDSSFNPDLESPSDLPQGLVSGPFQIPFQALIPEKVDGLLAAEKNIGVSRIANGATRLQPITMVIGQAVGAIAALAAKHKLQPRQINPLQVQLELLNAGCKLSLNLYRDVSRKHPLWQAVELASTHHLLEGNSAEEFGVDEPVTRAQTARALGLALDLDPGSGSPSPTFQDVDRDHPCFPYVEAVHARAPFPPSRRGAEYFCPAHPVLRREISALVGHILQAPLTQGNLQAEMAKLLDGYKNSWLDRLEGWISGTGNPQGRSESHREVTRGEMGAIAAALLLIHQGKTPYDPHRGGG